MSRTFFPCRDQSGAAAAEMALILPLLLVLLFGGFEAGHYFWTEHKVIKAVRDGARYAGRQSFDDLNCDTQDAGVVDNIILLTRTGSLDPAAGPLVQGWTRDDVTVSVSCNATDTGIYEVRSAAVLGGGETPGAPIVTVSATVEYPSLFGNLGFDTDGITVHASAQSPVMGL